MDDIYIKPSRLKGKRDSKTHNEIKDDKISLKNSLANKQFKALRSLQRIADEQSTQGAYT